jgi:hypothetical protein
MAYSPIILTDPTYTQRVRDKLGISDPNYLPDEVISQPDFIALSEAHIIDIVPNWANLTDDPVHGRFDRQYLEGAVVCECALTLLSTVRARIPTKEQGPHITVTNEIDWVAIEGRIQDDENHYLSNIAPNIQMTYFGTNHPSGGLFTIPFVGF